MHNPNRSALRSLVPSFFALALAACGAGGGSGSGFALSSTTQAASPSAAIVVAGDWIVYLASEAFSGPAGTDLNADGDTTDEVAFAVNTRSRTETNLGVAAQGAVVLGAEIYLVADEADGAVDWNGGGLTDIVLLNWSETSAVVVLVDVLDLDFSGELPRAVGDLLFYSSASSPGAGDETNLRSIDVAAPTTPVGIFNEIGGGTALVHLLGQDAGLLFCFFDEGEEGIDRNADGDTSDGVVLALLDGTDPAGRVKNVGLALADESEPLDAHVTAAHDWTVAFLVDENEQGGNNLNDQALFSQPLLPENCLGTPDADANDRVLFYLEYADFLAGLALPVDTGLAGDDRVLALDGFVATISPEGDANCNLNAGTGDTDTNDEVARWVATSAPITPARDAEDLHALATSIGGGSKGLSVLDDRLIAVISESDDDANHDGKAQDHDLVAWLDPSLANPVWHFSHQSSSTRSFGTGVFDSDGDSEPFAGTSWMAPEPVGDRLGLVFLEEVPGTNPNVGSLNTNLDCNLVAKDSDKTDGLPVWADFESGPTLDFDGMGYAVDQGNAGIEIAQGFAFFRVSEADDNVDYNEDGAKNDVVLFRNPLTTCGPVFMATSSLIPGQVITTDRTSAAAFLSSESQEGVDFNGDGDTGDLVVWYFRY